MDKYNNIKNVINEECDILYHLSWNGVRGNDRNDLEKQNLNLKNSIDLVKSCIDMNCKKNIIAGSQAEYGQTKGISFMENNILWHYRDPQNNEYIQAIKELEAEKNEKYFY
ncbi:MAG: hypothetical protein GX309_03540 [Clostridiales bacterium]|nr:hypothetical protein [Clostridiales bacterium]